MQEELTFLLEEYLNIEVSDGSEEQTAEHLLKIFLHFKKGNMTELQALSPNLTNDNKKFECGKVS